MNAPAEDRPERPRWLWFGFVAALLLASFPYFERLMNANERPRLLQAMALVDDGGWAIDAQVAAGWKPGPDVARGRESAGGSLYPNKPPGSSVVAAAAYAVHSATTEQPSMRGFVWWARFLAAVVPTLVIVLVAWRRYRDRVPWPAVAVALALYVFATPVTSYARLLFGHQLAAALLFGGVVAMLDGTGDEPRPALAAVGGALAGCAIAVEYTAAFAGLPIGVALAARVWGRRTEPRAVAVVGSALAGALVPVAALMAYHRHAFGSVWTTPYHRVTDAGFAAIHGQGLLGLSWPSADSLFEHVISPWGGLLVWCPLVVVVLVALGERVRSVPSDTESKLALGILLTLLAVNLGLSQAGGWRVGPRYFMVALPFAIPGLMHAAQRARDVPAVFVALAGPGLWSTFVNGLAANLFPHLIPVGNPLRDQLLPLWLGGRSTYGLAWWAHLGVLGPSVVVIGTMALVVISLLRVRPVGRRALWASLAVSMVFGALAYAVPPDPAADLTREAIEGMWEPSRDRRPRSPRSL